MPERRLHGLLSYIIMLAISALFAAHDAGRLLWGGVNRSPAGILLAVACAVLLALVNVRSRRATTRRRRSRPQRAWRGLAEATDA